MTSKPIFSDMYTKNVKTFFPHVFFMFFMRKCTCLKLAFPAINQSLTLYLSQTSRLQDSD